MSPLVAISAWMTPIEEDSPFLQPTAARYPMFIQNALNHWFSWDPQDLLPPLSEGCSKDALQKDLLKTKNSTDWNQTVQTYFQKCNSEAVQPYGPRWMGAFRIFAINYPLVGKSPLIKRVLLHLPNGQKLKAVLALKDQKKRPFVILRMGITGNVEEAFAERYFYHHLFERGFSHFMMVENMTGSDFIQFNQTLDFGGIHEGFQNIWIAQNLRNPNEPLSKLISSLHLIGLSLGGQGTLTASWLQPAQKNSKLYQSFLGFCPLVNTKATFENLFARGWLRFPLEVWARNRFVSVKTFKPEILTWEPGIMMRLEKVAKASFRKPQADVWGIIEPEFLKSITDFDELHSLSTWKPELRDPVDIWATRTDRIVPIDLNANNLVGSDPLLIDQGHHCTFPADWHPHVLQALFNAHILKSSTFQLSQREYEHSTNATSDWQFESVQNNDKKSVKIVLASKQKKTKQELILFKEDLDFHFANDSLGFHELNALKRWLSTNLKIEYKKDSRMTVSFPFVISNP